ncbi:MAG: zinc transporter ZntB [Magnetococcales bacterium]|nr:zinc transporter ZntB [Magnetococcales bacterium]
MELPDKTEPKQMEGLIYAILFDGAGGGRDLSLSEIEAWRPEQGFLWLHFQMNFDDTKDWIEQKSGLDPVVSGALINEDNHPRIVWEPGVDSLFGTLRGLNFNRKADLEDMVVVNLYIDSQRAITTRTARVMTMNTIVRLLKKGVGPQRPAGFLLAVLERLHDRMEPILEEISEELDECEEKLTIGETTTDELREKLIELRHEIIQLRRYLSPQKNAMTSLGKTATTWISKKRLREIREVEGRLQRFLADLDSYRERAVVIREEINNQLTEKMNRAMYMVSVVTGIFLPLGFLTGLLGINVGGMPGVESRWAFWIVCSLLVGCSIFCLWLFRRLKWI